MLGVHAQKMDVRQTLGVFARGSIRFRLAPQFVACKQLVSLC